MKLNDAVFGLLLLALGAASSPSFRPIRRSRPAGRACAVSGLIALGLVIGGVMLIVQRLARACHGARGCDLNLGAFAAACGRRALGVIGSVVFYIVAVDWLGFLLTSLIILVALFRLFGVALGRSVVIAAIATLVIHFAFYKLLRVPLPWGVLTPYAW